MIFNPSDNSPIPELVNYVTLKTDIDSIKDLENLKQIDSYILSQIQGESVMVEEGLDIPLMLYLFELIYNYSQELVFVTREGLKFQIFDHITVPVIRDDSIITTFSFFKESLNQQKVKTNSLTLNLENIWNKNSDKVNFLERVYKCVDEILKELGKAKKYTLIGKSPVLLFLITTNLLTGRTDELWYQVSERSKPIKIYVK